MTATTLDTQSAPLKGLYRVVWRWHFYAGLVVVPFLLLLAVTGLMMVYGNSVATKLGPRFTVESATTSLGAQAEIAEGAVPDSLLKLAVIRDNADKPTVFIVIKDETEHLVTVDGKNGTVLHTMVKADTWYHWASDIHGRMFLGDIGDRILEIVAGLGIVLVITGVYLWWPRERGLAAVLAPRLYLRGRALWKDLHVTIGFWISIFMLFFLLSGLAWTGIWGGKMVQAWSTFPAEKWDNVPLSDDKHKDMNHEGHKDTPWALEQTPMPESGSQAGITGLPAGTPINIDTIASLGRQLGFTGQYRVAVPANEDGVYTISADTMDGDTTDPAGDRTVHIDQFTGKILADVKFADYGLAGKTMAIGIALHQSDMGWWNVALNLLLCLAIIFMAISGVVMWWKRRPEGTVGAPLYPQDYRIPRFILVVSAVVAAVFPLTGIGLVLFAAIDFLLPKRLKQA